MKESFTLNNKKTNNRKLKSKNEFHIPHARNNK